MPNSFEPRADNVINEAVDQTTPEQPVHLIDYRRDIDGLRAVSIVAVLLFHAGISPFSGGYLGVDVFFVISGYLINANILSQLKAGSFTVTDFYERRARRILPSLFFVALTCLPLAWFCLLPPDMVGFSRSLLALLVFGTNIYFWQTGGYFESAANASPLIHTWSLAVEEQYYLLFPVMVSLIWRLRKPHLYWAIVASAFVSLALAQWASVYWPSANFYSLPTRGWELLTGAACALYAQKTLVLRQVGPGRPVREGLSLLGGLLVVYGILSFDATTPNPSLRTAPPVLGAALLLVFGAGTAIGKMLGHRVLVAIGLISYSTYLWHQPLNAFVRHISLEPPSKVLLAFLVFIAISLGYLSWRLIEIPFRDKTRVSRRRLVVTCVCSSAVLACFANSAQSSRGFASRLSSKETAVIAYANYAHTDIYREGVCFLRSEQAYTDFSSTCVTNQVQHPALLWGDSHAAALSFGLRGVIPGLVQYTASGCPPIGNYEGITSPHCPAINRFVLAQIGRIHPSQVILHANWSKYLKTETEVQLLQTINAIRKLSPTTRILIVGTVPQWYTSLPSSMLRTDTPLEVEVFLRSPYIEVLVTEDQKFETLAKYSGVEFFSAREALCRGVSCQVTTRYEGDITLTAWDYGHLTAGGSVLLATKLAQTRNVER